MSTAEWVSSILGALGLAGGAIGFFRARAAAKSSKESADIANRASDRSIAAAEAAADAQQRIAAAIEQRSLAEPMPVSPAVRWRVDQIAKSRMRLTNVGTDVAGGVTLRASPDEAEHLMRVDEVPDLQPHEGLSFMVLRTMGGPQVSGVAVTWTDSSGPHESKLRII